MSGIADEAAVVAGGRTRAVVALEQQARAHRVWVLVLRVLVGAGFVALWWYASGRWVDTLLISRPDMVAQRLWKWTLDGTLWDNLSITLWATVLGFGIGCTVGFALGLLFGRFTTLAEVFDPYITAIYSIPKIALAPLFIIWFGIGIESKVAVSAAIVFFVIFLNTYSGVREVNPLFVNSVRIMGGGEAAVLRHVIVPSAAAWVITGLKVSVPYALVGHGDRGVHELQPGHRLPDQPGDGAVQHDERVCRDHRAGGGGRTDQHRAAAAGGMGAAVAGVSQIVSIRFGMLAGIAWSGLQ